MYGSKRTNTFRKLMPKAQLLEQEEEEIAVKLENAYAKMRRRAVAREKRRKRGNANWEPKLHEKVKCSKKDSC
jgi:hypothetical protein